MSKRLTGALGLVIAASGLAFALPAPYDRHIEVPRRSFSFLSLPASTSRVNDLDSDGANRVWVSTPTGVSALEPGASADVGDPVTLLARSPFFPFDATDGLITNNVGPVDFAQVSSQEHFFLGFATPTGGFQYGRVLSTSGLSLPNDNRLKQGSTASDGVNDLDSAGTSRVWVGTGSDLEEWKIDGDSPILERVHQVPLGPGSNIPAVAVDPSASDAAAFATSATSAGRDEVWMVASGDTTPTRIDTGTISGVDTVVDLTFDRDGNLWGLGLSSTIVRVFRFDAGLLSPAATTVFSGPVGTFSIHGMAVDDEAGHGVVWIATSKGLWYQEQPAGGGIPTGTWIEAPLLNTNGTPQTENVVTRVFADPAGNIWAGTDGGVNPILIRLLSLSGTKFVGFGTPMTVTVIDADRTGTGSVQVEVDGAPRTLPENVNGAGDPTGTFRRTFTFAESDPSGAPDSDFIVVSSTTASTDVLTEYGFDPADTTKKISALASWSNEQPFEDDLWLGGPCFLDLLDR